MHDDILCVIQRMAQNKTQNRTNQKHTKGPRWWVIEATKLHAETRDPPSQDPRDHKEQPFRNDIHPGTSKQQRRVATRVVRRERTVKQEGETWSNVKMTAKLRHSGRTQSPLSSSFPSISIMGAAVCGHTGTVRIKNMRECRIRAVFLELGSDISVKKNEP